MPLPNFNRRSPQPQLLTNSFDGWRCNVSPCVAACGGNIEGTVRKTERVQSNAAKRLFCKLGDRKACETATLILIKPLRSCAPPPPSALSRGRRGHCYTATPATIKVRKPCHQSSTFNRYRRMLRVSNLTDLSTLNPQP